MEFGRVVRKRRMCRDFLEEDVPDDEVTALLEVAARFPSAGHTQPQEFIVVRDGETRAALGEAARGQMYLARAPVAVVTIVDTSRSARRYGRRGVDFYSIVDGAFASLLVLLAAVDRGLDAAFVGAFDDDEVRRVLDLPAHVRPIGIIPIGRCRDRGGRLARRPRPEIVHGERYGAPWTGAA